MGFKRLERILTLCFRRYGHFVGRRPVPFFIFPLLATVLLAPAIFLMRNNDNVILLFTPYDAPSRNELDIFNQFSMVQPLEEKSKNVSQGPKKFLNETIPKKKRYLLQTAKNEPRENPWIFLSIAYANGSNVMTVEAWRDLSAVIDYIYHNFSCQVTENSGMHKVRIRTLRYNPDFCDGKNGFQCPPLDKQIRNMVDILRLSKDHRGQEKSKIQLTYPVMYLWGHPVNWGQFIYGAEVNETTGLLLSASMVLLKLEFQFDTTKIEEYSARQCIAQMSDFVVSYQPEGSGGRNGDLHFLFSSEWYQNDQVSETKTRLIPFIPLTAALVTIFTVLSSYYSPAPVKGATEAVLGVVTIGLSLVASFAVLFLAGVQTNFVIFMTPVLTLCVGIDNDFLLMAAWRRPGLERLPPRKRLALAFVDAGPSLTITSINDMLCFAVGCLSESPAISDFCLFTCVALAFRFLYQMTFFAGVLVYLDEIGPKIASFWRKTISKLKRLEQNQTVLPLKPIDPELASRMTVLQPDSPAAPSVLAENCMHQFFRTRYSKFIARRSIRIFVTLIFIIYLFLAAFTASGLRVNVSLRKLVYDDSPLQEFFTLAEKYALKTQIGNVIVTKAPDFRQPIEIEKFLIFVDALETTPEYSPNPKDTGSLWLRDYLDFTSYLAEPGSDFYEFLDEFFESDQVFARYASDLRFKYSESGQLVLESFRFTTYYQNVLTWEDSVKLMLQWRSICQNYSDYGAIVQDYFFRNTYLDQRLTLSGSTLQTMGIASLMIAAVTGLLMPDAASMFFICFSSLSVDLGVIGALNYWGSDLDPVTMACLLMTIGFSVYYTARMCYCYQKADPGYLTVQKFAFSLGSVGWPILQGGVATWVGIIPLSFVAGYMTRTFFRTIVLVVAIGLCHGLLFMPVMMSLYDHRTPAIRKARLNRRNA